MAEDKRKIILKPGKGKLKTSGKYKRLIYRPRSAWSRGKA